MSGALLSVTVLLLSSLAVLGIVVVVAAIFLTRGRRSASADRNATPPAAMALLQAARRKAIFAIALASTVCVVLFMTGIAAHSLLGLPFLLAAPIASTAGLLLYTATRPALYAFEPDEVRHASLAPRRPTAYVSFRTVAGPLAVLVALIVFVVFAGMTASIDDLGLSRAVAFATESRSSRSSPYAGWFYGIPLLAACVALAAATAAALWRISAAPALPGGALAGVDDAWRRETLKVVSAISVFAMALPLGGAAAISGMSTLNAFFEGVPEGWQAVGIGLVTGGAALIVTAFVSIALATRRAIALPAKSIAAGRTPEPLATARGDL